MLAFVAPKTMSSVGRAQLEFTSPFLEVIDFNPEKKNFIGRKLGLGTLNKKSSLKSLAVLSDTPFGCFSWSSATESTGLKQKRRSPA